MQTTFEKSGKCTLKHLATKQKDFSAKSGKNLDDFLMEHPDVFKIDGSTVTLLEDTRYLTKDTSNTEEVLEKSILILTKVFISRASCVTHRDRQHYAPPEPDESKG